MTDGSKSLVCDQLQNHPLFVSSNMYKLPCLLSDEIIPTACTVSNKLSAHLPSPSLSAGKHRKNTVIDTYLGV